MSKRAAEDSLEVNELRSSSKRQNVELEAPEEEDEGRTYEELESLEKEGLVRYEFTWDKAYRKDPKGSACMFVYDYYLMQAKAEDITPSASEFKEYMVKSNFFVTSQKKTKPILDWLMDAMTIQGHSVDVSTEQMEEAVKAHPEWTLKQLKTQFKKIQHCFPRYLDKTKSEFRWAAIDKSVKEHRAFNSVKKQRVSYALAIVQLDYWVAHTAAQALKECDNKFEQAKEFLKDMHTFEIPHILLELHDVPALVRAKLEEWERMFEYPYHNDAVEAYPYRG